MRRGVVGVVLAVSGGTLLAGGLVSGPASGATGAGKRPDLVVTKSALQLRGGGSWTTQLATRTFTWRHRTKNVGGLFGTDPGYRVLSASFAPSFRVPLTVTCPMTPPTTSPVAPFGGGSAPWLATGSTSPFPDPGLSAISGTFQLVATTAPVTYTWNLVASG